MLIVDAHEDIAWNMLTFGRDYTRSALITRREEAGSVAPLYNGNTLLGRTEWLLGRVGVIFATLFAAPARFKHGAWDTQCYHDPAEAYRIASAQLDAYHRLADEHEQFRLIGSRADLDEVLATWAEGKTLSQRRIGLVPLMEGADPIQEPEQAEEWFERGVRIVGLAWEATRYAGGTHEPGPLTSEGRRLLGVMADLGMVLDLSHLAEQAYYEALDHFEGVTIASHSNPRRFTPTSRGLSDAMIERLAERGGVIGIVPYNVFLKPGVAKSDGKHVASLEDVADAIDHVCQITGSAAHVGIGSDFDGGFGVEHVPQGIDTVADLQNLRGPLAERGYTADQIAAIFSGNWIRMLKQALANT
ncbi:MAG: membrane dipeptidase [Anaerolineae bacterium]